MLVFVVADPYRSNIADVSIHVSYDRDEDSPPMENSTAPRSDMQQASNIDGNVDQAVDSEGVKQVDESTEEQMVPPDRPPREGMAEKEQHEVDQPTTTEKSEQASHTNGDTGEQNGEPVSSEEASGTNVIQTQENQFPTSSGQEQTQTDNQPTEET